MSTASDNLWAYQLVSKMTIGQRAHVKAQLVNKPGAVARFRDKMVPAWVVLAAIEDADKDHERFKRELEAYIQNK